MAAALTAAPLSAQLFPRQCAQDQVPGNCGTCIEVIGECPTGASIELRADKCPDTPTSNCMPCCWDVKLNFDPGLGTVWYPGTYLQFGDGTTIQISAGFRIAKRKTTPCTTENVSGSCVKGVVAFGLGFFPNTKCLQLDCPTCPAPVQD